jgi:hypothetical protein
MEKKFNLLFRLILVAFILFLILNYTILTSKLHSFLPFLQNVTYFSTTRISKTIFFSKNESDKKYLVYECTNENICGGWGDRLKGIMSAYAISLLTDRYFLINHVKPCLLTHYFEPSIYFLNTTINYDQASKLWFISNEDYRKSLSFINAFNLTSKYISIKNNLEWIEPISKNKILDFNKDIPYFFIFNYLVLKKHYHFLITIHLSNFLS